MSEAYLFSSHTKNPGRIVENSELEERLSLKYGVIERLTGIQKRYWISDSESLCSIASDACIEVIRRSGIDPHEIDLMIFYTEVPPTYRENGIICRRYYEVSPHIQITLKRQSVDINCECFNMGGSCVVFISALQAATSMIKAGFKKNVLIVGASTNSIFLDDIDRNSLMAFGDGAAATLICSSDRQGFIDFFRMTDGEGFDSGYFDNYSTLIIDRKRVAEFAPLACMNAVDGLLKKTGSRIEEISLVIPHQAGDRIIRKGMELACIPEEKVYYCLDKYGNTGGPALQIALSNAIAEGRIGSGDLVMLVAFGIGWNYGAALLRL
jgi:3-oxoacyl-[acyl-carrier-protein] synthase-3